MDVLYTILDLEQEKLLRRNFLEFTCSEQNYKGTDLKFSSDPAFSHSS